MGGCELGVLGFEGSEFGGKKSLCALSGCKVGFQLEENGVGGFKAKGSGGGGSWGERKVGL